MRNYIILLFLALSFSSCKVEETETTYYLIRHAEKDRSNPNDKNPSLTEEGLARAENWANYFKDIHLDAVYSTKYNRTKQTAKPTAESKGLTIQNYDPRSLYNVEFAKETFGKTVLVVGHSNTTPAFANRIINENSKGDDVKVYQNMDDSDNATLFIVKLTTKGKFGKNKLFTTTEKVGDQ